MTHYNHFAVFENETAAYGQAQVCRTAEPWGSACWFFWAHEYEQGHWKQQINRTIVLWDVSQAVLIRSERLRDHCLAEEAVQETFRIACAKADRLAESENRQGWLINTLKFVIRNTLRNQTKLKNLLLAAATMMETSPGISERDVNWEMYCTSVLGKKILSFWNGSLLKTGPCLKPQASSAYVFASQHDGEE